MDKLLIEKLEYFCPKKTLKLADQEKPFITTELKTLARKRNREYVKNGKSIKYYELRKSFKMKYKLEAKKYLDKNVESLSHCKPGQSFRILKRLGSQSEVDEEGFVLTGHENLSALESAEKIAAHFSEISGSFPPLSVKNLPDRLKEKLRTAGCAPKVSEYEVYCKIKQAKKSRSGTDYDLPRDIVNEFSPELATPLARIINKIFSSYEWPKHWKVEHVVPIPKVPTPESENDLRPISLTPFFSKVTEHFVVQWLLDVIGPKIDFRQYGGLRGNSISHYIIEFINFILSSQDSSEQTAVLACFIDFQKAFMRQNHNILIEKLSDLDVPGWLLKIIISFLEDRSMFVK